MQQICENRILVSLLSQSGSEPEVAVKSDLILIYVNFEHDQRPKVAVKALFILIYGNF